MGFSDWAKDKASGAADKVKDKISAGMPGADSFDAPGGDVEKDDSVAVLYADAQFRGKPTKLKVGRYTYKDFACGNDAVSSVTVKKGYKVTLFEHVDFKGKMRVITEDTASLAGFNDQASSAIVEKR